jgi:hypothetical protein
MMIMSRGSKAVNREAAVNEGWASRIVKGAKRSWIWKENNYQSVRVCKRIFISRLIINATEYQAHRYQF